MPHPTRCSLGGITKSDFADLGLYQGMALAMSNKTGKGTTLVVPIASAFEIAALAAEVTHLNSYE
jgi:hypothetical protein